MCGIFGFLTNHTLTIEEINALKRNCDKIKHRGPDNTKYYINNTSEGSVFLGFHRLAINDISANGDQPLVLDDTYYLICNGEIYNHQDLETEYGFKTHGHSDCEVILHLYKMFGIKKTCELISGYFAFLLYDKSKDTVYAVRDPIGVRALYIGINGETVGFCSELKGLSEYVELDITQFRPGCYWDSVKREYVKYKEYRYNPDNNLTLQQHMDNIRDLFEKAVFKRFMLERPFGVFLSGGLDSSLVAALVAKHNYPNQIHSFSIGMEGSTDLKNARLVAEHINSIHHEVIVTPQQMLDAIPEVIKQLETYDTTTIRAGTPMYLLSKYIKENTDIVVIFSGEGSDEASGSYLYFHNAPDEKAFSDECFHLLDDLCYFDCLRCDKATAGNGLEVRVPFLDKEFLTAYMNVPTSYKLPKDNMEKWFIRKAFDGNNLLPESVLWRKKEAFSDGVSSTEKSWFQIIQEHISEKISDDEFLENKDKYSTNAPKLKETYYYRKIFEDLYPDRANILPYYWLPKWSGHTDDPSARVLNIYNELD